MILSERVQLIRDVAQEVLTSGGGVARADAAQQLARDCTWLADKLDYYIASYETECAWERADRHHMISARAGVLKALRLSSGDAADYLREALSALSLAINHAGQPVEDSGG